MRMLVFSDIHIHGFKAFATFRGGDNSRRIDCLRRLEKAVERANRTDIDCVVFAGDFFQERGKVDIVTVARSKEILGKLRKPLVACSGTHDITRAGYSAMASFEEMFLELGSRSKRRFFLDEETVLYDSALTKWVFVVVPACEPSSMLQRKVEEALERAVKNHGRNNLILVTHGNVLGKEFGLPHWMKDGLKPEFLIDNFAQSFVGHNHQPFEYHNILMPGAAIPRGFGDKCEGGSFWVVEIVSTEAEQDGGILYERRVERILFEHPAFVTVRQEDVERFPYNEYDYYRIFTDKEELNLPEGVRYVLARPKAPTPERPIDLFPQDSKADLVDKYVDKKTQENPRFDFVRLKLTGRVLLESGGRQSLGEDEMDALEEIWSEE